MAVIQNTAGSQCDDIGAEALRWAILDKTAQHWPTNTFEPTFSPVTNWPQAALNALTGLYVGGAGYHKIEAVSTTLTLTANAFIETPTVTSNLVPRVNGWFSAANSQSNQLAFTNLAGHAMLVLHQVNGAFESVNPLGERYVPTALSVAWNARTNRVYRLMDMYPDDFFWDPPYFSTLRFKVKDGALMTEWMFGPSVIEPQNDNLAFQRGVHYRKGGAVQVTTTNGFELLHYSSYRFLDEAAIPTLPVSAITNGSIPFVNGTQWYWFTGQTGTTYQARLMAPNQNHFVRITDREGIVLASGTNGPAAWTCASDGAYAIAVSATNVFSFTASLIVCGLRPTQSDYDGDGLADPVLYDSGSGVFTVFLSGSGYSSAAVQLSQPTAYSLQPASADFDGDGLADPAVYDPLTGLLTILFSSQADVLVTQSMGGAGCIPVVGDFDGDRKADPTVYTASAGRITIWLSGSEYSAVSVSLGRAGWINACEDYDGDGKTDPAVYEAASGMWQLALSGNGYALTAQVTAGGAGVVSVPGDYDGDGMADLMVYQAASGLWLCALSSQGYAMYGLAGIAGPAMTPRPGDYDNDGRTDPAVYDPVTRTFYIMLSGSSYQTFSLSL